MATTTTARKLIAWRYFLVHHLRGITRAPHTCSRHIYYRIDSDLRSELDPFLRRQLDWIHALPYTEPINMTPPENVIWQRLIHDIFRDIDTEIANAAPKPLALIVKVEEKLRQRSILTDKQEPFSDAYILLKNPSWWWWRQKK